MPLEKRDPHSKARLFIPTNRERAMVHSQRLLNKELDEVAKLKEELRQLIDESKK